jgi:hypothetical protein
MPCLKRYGGPLNVKLVPEFFDAKLIICITFPDKPGDGSMQVIGSKFWLWICIDAPHNTEIKPWICENMDSKSTCNKSYMYKIQCTKFLPGTIMNT